MKSGKLLKQQLLSLLLKPKPRQKPKEKAEESDVRKVKYLPKLLRK